MILVKVKQGHLIRDRHFDSSQFLLLLLLLKVFKSIALKYLHDSSAEYSKAAVDVSIF